MKVAFPKEEPLFSPLVLGMLVTLQHSFEVQVPLRHSSS